MGTLPADTLLADARSGYVFNGNYILYSIREMGYIDGRN
jgi:hypothetical protein